MARPRRTKGLDREFITQVAQDENLRAIYEPLVKKCKGHTFESFAFAILTANEKTDRAEKALALIKLQHPSSWAEYAILLKESGCMFWNQKAKSLSELSQIPLYKLSPDIIESCSEYRDRLLCSHIRGLAFVKTSFACMLAYGGGDVICPDRHILNIYFDGAYENWMANQTKKTMLIWRAVEAYFVKVANEFGWDSASALQWAVWDSALKTFHTHSVVYL